MKRLALIPVLVIIVAACPAVAQITPQVAFPGLPYWNRPVALVDAYDGADYLYLVEHRGIIYRFWNDPGVTSVEVFLDIESQVTRQGESGLVGLVFHPDYENNGYFYTFYADTSLNSVLSRWTVSADPDSADVTSEQILFTLPKTLWYHNGGHMTFGDDGYLYICTGDDGVPENGQILTNLHSALLRIDVDTTTVGTFGTGYGIPPDNPFAADTTGIMKEIWAYGLRNPWGFNFDRDTGWLWAGDVGLDSIEEIDIIFKGRNYGWPILEGNQCYVPNPCDTDTVGLDLVAPLHTYPHGVDGYAITGGFVYRGTRIPELEGLYIYGDYVSGNIWALRYDGVVGPYNYLLYSDPGFSQISSWGEDKDNNLFLTNMNGRIYWLTGTPTPVEGTPAPRTSLRQNYPNPFNPETTIEYDLSEPGYVSIEIFDIRGARVRTLVEKSQRSGPHAVRWDGVGDNGRPQASGVYFYRLSVDGTLRESKRMVLLK